MIFADVHTTGINWQGLFANVASITVVIVTVGAVLARLVKRNVSDSVRDVVTAEVKPVLDAIQNQLDNLDRRVNTHDMVLAHLSGVEDGKRLAIGQAGLHTTTTP